MATAKGLVGMIRKEVVHVTVLPNYLRGFSDRTCQQPPATTAHKTSETLLEAVGQAEKLGPGLRNPW